MLSARFGYHAGAKSEKSQTDDNSGLLLKVTIRSSEVCVDLCAKLNLVNEDCMVPQRESYSGWWFGTSFIFHIGNNHPNWLSYFSEGWPTTNQFKIYVGFSFAWIIPCKWGDCTDMVRIFLYCVPLGGGECWAFPTAEFVGILEGLMVRNLLPTVSKCPI